MSWRCSKSASSVGGVKAAACNARVHRTFREEEEMLDDLQNSPCWSQPRSCSREHSPCSQTPCCQCCHSATPATGLSQRTLTLRSFASDLVGVVYELLELRPNDSISCNLQTLSNIPLKGEQSHFVLQDRDPLLHVLCHSLDRNLLLLIKNVSYLLHVRSDLSDLSLPCTQHLPHDQPLPATSPAALMETSPLFPCS